MIRFYLSKANIHCCQDNLKIYGFYWRNTSLRMHYLADKGFIKTNKGSFVEAWRQPNKNIRYELFKTDSGEIIVKPKSFFRQFKSQIDISYNCYGHCFANSKFWIPDPTAIIDDEYKITSEKKAEIIMLREVIGCNEWGFKNYNYVHAVKVIDNKLISYKPGIGAFVENVHKKFTNDSYNFNNKIFLKKIL